MLGSKIRAQGRPSARAQCGGLSRRRLAGRRSRRGLFRRPAEGQNESDPQSDSVDDADCVPVTPNGKQVGFLSANGASNGSDDEGVLDDRDWDRDWEANSGRNHMSITAPDVTVTILEKHLKPVQLPPGDTFQYSATLAPGRGSLQMSHGSVPGSLPRKLPRKVPQKVLPGMLLCFASDLEMPAIKMPPDEHNSDYVNVAHMSVEELVTSYHVYNNEIAWLHFNWRVLSMALLPSVPLIERLQFLAITSSNLDGFFAKRVGGLMKQHAAGARNMKTEVKHSPSEQLRQISLEVKRMRRWQFWALQKLVLPQMQLHGIQLLTAADLSELGMDYLRHYYQTQVDPVLTPIKLDVAHPFPCLPSGSLNVVVELQDPAQPPEDSYSGMACICAIVPVPAILPKWVQVDPDFARQGKRWTNGFISLDKVIMQNLKFLFAGVKVRSAHSFRVVRNAELDRQKEEADDLLDVIADELREARFAPFVRLDVEADTRDDLADFLAHELRLKVDRDVYRIPQLLDLQSLASLVRDSNPNPDLVYPPWKPTPHPRLSNPFKHRHVKQGWKGKKWKDIRSIFEVIRSADLLLHHPYQSFASSTQRFVEEAARDPDVIAIKATLYRTSSDSPIIASLLKAAENGKQVAVLVELKARFDEERNVGFAQSLEDAGCNVAYGIMGLKTHAKCMCVVRREKNAPHGIRTYVHIGTGNYNPTTASRYTDVGILSSNPAVGQDVVDLFKMLTGIHMQKAIGGFRRLLVGNEYMKEKLLEYVDVEIQNARAGLQAAICVKVNGLDDPDMCRKLYDASMAGVRVDLIVRGQCRIRPGLAGRSENIRVVSVIGQFLEHHRIYCFYNGGDTLWYASSGDWLTRNLTNRVEVAVPVTRKVSQDRLRELLSMCLLDRWTWEMQPTGAYRRPATRTSEAQLSAVMLGQPDFPPEQMAVLEESGVQGCLMWSMLEKIKTHRQSDGRVF